MRRINSLVVGVALVALVGAPASAHELDHPAPATSLDGPISTAFNAGGEGATWQLVTTIVTGNPHSDLDYFTGADDELYLSAGTLGTGANGGGQTIVRLTEGGRPSQGGELAPAFVAGHPSAACSSDPAAALGLQHDVEATPKGDVLLNTDWGGAVDRDAPAQLLLDASDAEGRCHDGGTLGLDGAPQGGIEVVDVTDPANPVEIALTSHVGEAHTVNVDPSRPHLAYVVTSDAVSVSDGVRQNEVAGSSDQFDLDGFELLDLSSCLTAPYGTMEEGLTTGEKREACQPEVYRFRYPELSWSLGHTNQGSIYGCHELEVHPDDILTCGSGAALITLDMAGVFADADGDGLDEIQGTPLPCSRRASSSAAPFGTGAQVTDCVVGQDGTDLSVPAWWSLGEDRPQVEGVDYLGSIHHQGRESTTGALQPAFDATEDIDFNHEAELTHSGDFVLATDERGGGVTVGAQCSPGVDLTYANGGIHAYPVDALRDSETQGVPDAETAQEAYAQTPDGDRAIARAPINTQPQATECTAHVFHQIPGQNRIFMGWYSQGTQVFDYVENEDGTFEWHHVGWFTPEYANTWTSAVFDFWENEDGSWTYLGATGDFNVGNGRSAIDVYEVTLPAPRQFADGSAPEDPEDPEEPEEPGDRPECDDERPGQQPPHCDGDGRPGDVRRGNDQDEAAANGGRGGEGRPEDNGSEGRTRAAAGDTRPAPTPTTVIDLRPAASGTAPSSSPSVPASLSLLLGLSLLLIGVARRRRAD